MAATAERQVTVSKGEGKGETPPGERARRGPEGVVQAAVRWVLSVPIYLKILGIGAVVAAVFFGTMTLYARPRVDGALHALHEDQVRATTVSLAAVLERPVMEGDTFMIRQQLDNARLAFQDVRYAVVYDGQGRVLAHTLEGGAPPPLTEPPTRSSSRYVAAPGQGAGDVFDVVVPIQGGVLGSLRLGASDEEVERQLSALTRSVFMALLVCVALGQGLAILLALVLTRPIKHLVRAADGIRLGRFDQRAQVMWGDEVGELAVAFNEMASALESYERQVRSKEDARRGLIKRLVQAQEQERRGIALELHDELGQSLMAVLLSVHALRRTGELSASGAAALEEQIRWITDEVRSIARRMRPSLLDDGGLEVALESYVEETAARSEVLIDYTHLGDGSRARLPSEVEVTLFRIAQEGLTNVLRHSAASRVRILLARSSDEASLVVEDDGVGFDATCLDVKRECCGLGLMGMQERATLLGGRLSIRSAPGSGTTVRVTIPMHGEAHA